MSWHIPILATLVAHESSAGLPMTCELIAEKLNADPRKIYASMSGMGRQANRYWIEPVVHRWGRRASFRITNAGIKHLAMSLIGQLN